jgi:hypothetical protein
MEREISAIAGYFWNSGGGGDRRLQHIFFRYDKRRSTPPCFAPSRRHSLSPSPSRRHHLSPSPSHRHRCFLVLVPIKVHTILFACLPTLSGGAPSKNIGDSPSSYPIPAIFTIGCNLCIRADGHVDRNLRATQQEENPPPRGRLLNEVDDGKISRRGPLTPARSCPTATLPHHKVLLIA